MAKLKLGAIPDDRPVKLTIELPAGLHRDLVAYAELLGRETGQEVEPVRLIAPMLTRFMAADRGFSAARKSSNRSPARVEGRLRGITPDGLGEGR
ncbi:DUF2274 domain-containing protein [Inquilinus limosus]|uniref:DUF2274 domain-containing protein n=1 Tax=Inquilinus limosus TaxID=171674 RepID=A0A211ZEL9_9PROT|nr:DUF2274 domain-containing protein [Inquilinus limosus]OWJ63732.1 hypothetical protein BWR60_28220 [Inquilinus limosus]